MELLRKYVFIHLSEPGDKLQLMLAMLHKLYALVRPGGATICTKYGWLFIETQWSSCMLAAMLQGCVPWLLFVGRHVCTWVWCVRHSAC